MGRLIIYSRGEINHFEKVKKKQATFFQLYHYGTVEAVAKAFAKTEKAS